MWYKLILSWCLNLLVLTGVFGTIALSRKPANAQSQIVPDSSLGAESSSVAPLDSTGIPVDVIDGGATRGVNLFHSFKEFNVGEFRGTYFQNSSNSIQNIIARVTGNNSSEIFGVLGVFNLAGVTSKPNLLLMNSNGILFGKNASLDIQGSFFATTANSMQFGEQGVFSTVSFEAPALLTINPSALLFNKINSNATIINNATINYNSSTDFNFGLQVPNGKNIVLVGGNVALDGGWLRAPGGRVEIGAVEGVGSVGLNADASLNFPTDFPRADVALSNQSFIDVKAGGGGNVTINARNLNLSGSSNIETGISFGEGEPGSQAGDITLNTTGTLQLTEQSRIDNSVRAQFFTLPAGVGNSGNITINTGSLIAAGGSRIVNNVGGEGNAGSIIIQAKKGISLDGTSLIGEISSGIVSDVASIGKGNGGNIEINTSLLSLTNKAQISASTFGRGNAGNITINARDVYLDRQNTTGIRANGIFSTVESEAIGKGGNIIINSDSLSLVDSTLRAFTRGEGNAGNISIKTNLFSISGSSDINTQTKHIGNAGNIFINARDSILLTGIGKPRLTIFSIADSGAVGKGGNIDINTGSVYLKDDAQVQTATGGKGDAGNITINARDNVTLDGSSVITSKVIQTGEGKGGNINLTTGSLLLTSGSQIDASTSGENDAGNIKINVRDNITIDGAAPLLFAVDSEGLKPGDLGFSSGIFSTVGQIGNVKQAIGNGGNIQITTGSLFGTNGGQILTDVYNGRGNAGNVIINARSNVVFDGKTQPTASGQFGASGIASSLTGINDIGKGGNIEITANSLSLSSDAKLDTRTQGLGNAGQIKIQANNIFLNDGRIFSSVSTSGEGKGGNIFITGQLVDLSNQAIVFAGSFGQGEGGNITIKANTLQLTNKSEISAETATTNGGNINLTVDSLLFLRSNSSVSATAGLAELAGDGGNININSKYIIAFPEEDSDIRANAFKGRGGNVLINSQGIFGIESRSKPTNKSDITASSQRGISGVTIIDAPEINSIQNSFTELPSFINTNALIANSCISRSTNRQENSFTVTGSGALRNAPENGLNSIYSTGNVRSFVPASRSWKKGDSIIEPQGVYKLPDGQLILSRSC